MTFKKTNVLIRFSTLDYQRPVKININKMTTENNYLNRYLLLTDERKLKRIFSKLMNYKLTIVI